MTWKCILEKSWKCIQLTVYPGDDLNVYSKMSWKCIQLTVYPGDDLKVYSKMSWKCIQLTVYPGDDLKVYSKEDLKVYSWDAAEDSSALYQITSDKWRRGYGRENTTYVHTFLLGALFTGLNVLVAYQKWQKSGKGMRRRLVFPKIEQFRPFPDQSEKLLTFWKLTNTNLQTHSYKQKINQETQGIAIQGTLAVSGVLLCISRGAFLPFTA